jgi:hypothetical protein
MIYITATGSHENKDSIAGPSYHETRGRDGNEWHRRFLDIPHRHLGYKSMVYHEIRVDASSIHLV